jgi:hypothetical protein
MGIASTFYLVTKVEQDNSARITKFREIEGGDALGHTPAGAVKGIHSVTPLATLNLASAQPGSQL